MKEENLTCGKGQGCRKRRKRHEGLPQRDHIIHKEAITSQAVKREGSKNLTVRGMQDIFVLPTDLVLSRQSLYFLRKDVPEVALHVLALQGESQ